MEINGTWVGGVIGALESGEADIGLCAVWVREKEMRHADVIPYEEINLRFIISSVPMEEKWKSIYSPFSWSLWGCVLFTVVVSFSSMYFLSKLSGNKEGFVDWVFLVFGHFMGCVSLPAEGPIAFRVSVISVAFASLMFTTLYSSAILSHLTHPPVVPPPKTVKDLVTRDYYWSRSRPVKDPRTILNEADEWQRKFISRYKNISDMGPAIKKSRFAYYISHIGLLFLWGELPTFAYHGTGNLMTTRLKETISRSSVGIATRKGTIITTHISLALDRLVSSGVISKFRQEKEAYILSRWQRRVGSPPGLKPLSLASLQGAFFLMLCGFVMSTIAFLVEIYLDYKKQKLAT